MTDVATSIVLLRTNETRRRELDGLAAKGARFVLGWRVNATLRRAVAIAPAFAFVLPLLAVLYCRGLLLPGHKTDLPSIAGFFALAVPGPVAYVVARLISIFFQLKANQRFHNLALYDKQLADAERLVTADEFLAATPSSAFAQASIEDADQYLEAASRAVLDPLPLPPWRARWWSVAGVAGALMVSLFASYGMQVTAVLPGTAGISETASSAEDASIAGELPSEERRAEVRKNSSSPPGDVRTPASLKQTPALPEQRTAANTAAAQARSGTAYTAQMANQSNTASMESGASGAPSHSKQIQPEARNSSERRKPAPKPPTRRPEDKAQSMNAAGGAGGAASPGASDSRLDAQDLADRAAAGPEPKEVEDESEEDVDEPETERSAGTSTPVSRERKPPADRNASASFNRSRPLPSEGNGRSSGSGLKKTRGVPSMILGIPFPDRVPGMLSPGRSKTIQEAQRPTPESHAQIEAQQRLARSGPMGSVDHSPLLPWMQALVKDYFLTANEQAPAPRQKN